MRSSFLTGSLVAVATILLFLPAVSRRTGATAGAAPPEAVRATTPRPALGARAPRWLRPARKALAEGRWADAVAALTATPASPVAGGERELLLGMATWRAGDAEGARDVLVPALAADRGSPLAPHAARDLGDALTALGDPAGAEAAHAMGVERASPAAEGPLRLRWAESLAVLDRVGEAREAVRPLLREGAAAGALPEALWLAASLAEDAGDADEALRLREFLYLEHPCSAAGRAVAELDAFRGATQRLAGEGRIEELLVRLDGLLDCRMARTALGDADRIAAFDLSRADRDAVELHRGRALRLKKDDALALDALQRVTGVDPVVGARAAYNGALAAKRLRRTGDWRRLLRQACSGPSCRWRDEALADLAEHDADRGRIDDACAAWAELAASGHDDDARAEAAWWRAWTLHRVGRLDEALEGYHALLVNHPRARQTGAALYWCARIERERGREVAADELLARAAGEFPNGYYGLVAALELGREPTLPAPPSADGELADVAPIVDVVAQADHAAGVRLAALIRAGLTEETLAEVSWLEQDLADGADRARQATWQLRVVTLGRAGRTLDALRTLRRSAADWRMRTDISPAAWHAAYPLGFRELIERESAERNLDPALIFALVHQESVFDAEARSWVGARGLMQIMPGTGQTIARWFGERVQTNDLHDPDLNVRYGTEYLRRLLDRFHEPELALAGYNAGGGRVRRWLQESPASDLPFFVESIPFDETRNYVKAVTWNRVFYRSVYLGPQHSSPSGLEELEVAER